MEPAQRIAQSVVTQGTRHLPNGAVEFRIWAPKAKAMAVVINGASYEMTLHDEIWSCTLATLPPNADYLYSIDGHTHPDPASRWQPAGVHGPSRLYNPAGFRWDDAAWKPLPLERYVIYELHVGTYTPEGTFEALISKLPYLKELGITAIELMPVGEFPGTRDWGYDGVYWYAPHHAYGGPEGLQRLVNACHQAGLAVVLDVIYNHFGAEGNYADAFAPYHAPSDTTPWGEALNYADEHVRRFIIDNALQWFDSYHIDALRVDAVHAMADLGMLGELGALHRGLIIAESDLNDTRLLLPADQGGYGLDAQWSDDFHHATHALATNSTWRYFGDFGQLEQLARSIRDGFVYTGQWSSYRKKQFGTPSTAIPGKQFIICIQNHDQVGNANQGKRLSDLITIEQYKLLSMLLLCAPNIPLLFMGQEWSATTPFCFFSSFEDEAVIRGVREGYQREFDLKEPIDPQQKERFLQCKINWQELEKTAHEEMLAFYRQLLKLRSELPCLGNCRKDLTTVSWSEPEQWLLIGRGDPSGSQAIVAANCSTTDRTVQATFPPGQWTLRLETTPTKQPPALDLVEGTTQLLTLPPWSAILYCT